MNKEKIVPYLLFILIGLIDFYYKLNFILIIGWFVGYLSGVIHIVSAIIERQRGNKDCKSYDNE